MKTSDKAGLYAFGFIIIGLFGIFTMQDYNLNALGDFCIGISSGLSLMFAGQYTMINQLGGDT